MIKEWELLTTNQHRLRKANIEVVVLPIGATEPHNLHLPEGMDVLHTSYVAGESCRLAWEKTKKVICLPTIPYGVECNLLDFPMAIHVSQATLDAMVRDVVTSLSSYGIRKIVILNGHGGNDFTPMARQLQRDLELFPELVEFDQAKDGKVREFAFEALRNGWISCSRNFSKLNDHCAVGDPSRASAEKGRKYLDLVINRISKFLEELANAPIEEHFPFK